MEVKRCITTRADCVTNIMICLCRNCDAETTREEAPTFTGEIMTACAFEGWFPGGDS